MGLVCNYGLVVAIIMFTMYMRTFSVKRFDLVQECCYKDWCMILRVAAMHVIHTCMYIVSTMLTLYTSQWKAMMSCENALVVVLAHKVVM